MNIIVYILGPIMNIMGVTLSGKLSDLNRADHILLSVILTTVVTASVNNPFGGTTCIFNATTVTSKGA